MLEQILLETSSSTGRRIGVGGRRQCGFVTGKSEQPFLEKMGLVGQGVLSLCSDPS